MGSGPAHSTQELEGFSMTRSQKGAVEWKLEAKSADLDESAEVAGLDTPHIEIFKKGKADTTVDSKSGEVDLKTQDMTLAGSVVVVGRTDGTTLKTEKLRYVSSAKEFRTDEPVAIERDGSVMRGKGMTASQDLSVIRVKKQETRVQ